MGGIPWGVCIRGGRSFGTLTPFAYPSPFAFTLGFLALHLRSQRFLARKPFAVLVNLRQRSWTSLSPLFHVEGRELGQLIAVAFGLHLGDGCGYRLRRNGLQGFVRGSKIKARRQGVDVSPVWYASLLCVCGKKSRANDLHSKVSLGQGPPSDGLACPQF